MKTANGKIGSALIMTIVLTVLLAIVGTMFMLMARSEKAATSSRSDNEELKLAADSIVGTIMQRLADDVPRVPRDVNDKTPEYYDYPGRWYDTGFPDLMNWNDSWLANLEPYDNGGYKWRHVSDVYNTMETYAYDVPITAPQALCEDYQKTIDTNAVNNASLADADGDGVADARWVQVPDLTTSKGKPVYTAVRIVDNGGMLNVNTGYKFDPNYPDRRRVDGSSRLQVNLAAMSERDHTNSNLTGRLFRERVDAIGIASSPSEPDNAIYWNFNDNYIWPLKTIIGYTPFDISDELKLRNRYILNNNNITTRIEELWENAYDGGLETPRNTSTGISGIDWFFKANNSSADPCQYDYRHITTTYNMDRIIDPCGFPMLRLNGGSFTAVDMYNTFKMIIDDPCIPPLEKNRLEEEYAQLAVYLADCRDSDANVSTLAFSGKTYYGMEPPIMYISELARNFRLTDATMSGDPNYWARSYAIEVCKWPGSEQFNATLGNDWELVIQSGTGTQTITLDANSFARADGRYVVKIYENTNALLSDQVAFSDQLESGQTNVPPNSIFEWDTLAPEDKSYYDPNATFSYDVYFGTSTDPVAIDEIDIATRYDSPPSPFYKGEQSSELFNPGGMIVDQTYYIRVDDVVKDENGNVIDILQGESIYFTVGTGPQADVNSNLPMNAVVFDAGSTLTLRRRLPSGDYLVADSVSVPPWLVSPADEGVRTFQRDINRYRWIQRFWDPNGMALGMWREQTLGHFNSYEHDPSAYPKPLQMWFSHHGRWWFRNVGDIGYMFKKPVYYVTDPISEGTIGYPVVESTTPPVGWDASRLEENVRINLADPYIQNLFQYLTVFNPGQGWGNSSTETRGKGRVNINTAPWFVIAQLPWVSKRKEVAGYDATSLARAIVAYRDKTKVQNFTSIDYSGRWDGTGLGAAWGLREEPGFASIGELTTVINKATLTNPTATAPEHDYSMWYYEIGSQVGDQIGTPDMTTRRLRMGRGSIRRGDGVADDYEERNLIFARISDLVTVRSDVFTAYILIRLGTDGPQRRVIAILDRSGYPNEPVKVIALQAVPEAR